MKKYLVALTFLTTTQLFAFTDININEIMFLDRQYTITHLNDLNVDCVWTKDEHGRIQSEAMGPDGTGVCWDIKSVKQAEKLDKEKKLIWHNPPNFDYEYGDKNKCYYKIDKKNDFIIFTPGDNITDSEANECRKESSKEKALKLAKKIEKNVTFGGYVATKNNILGSVLLACYTGSINSDDKFVSNEERTKRYKQLLSLYEDDEFNIKRINNAFMFAKNNLSDRYPLDTEGQYRADVCDQMVRKGKL